MEFQRQGKQAKCWINEWILFRVMTATYDNFITFLNSNNLAFIAETKLDFTRIPTSLYGITQKSMPYDLHGRGMSENLLEYLANNEGNSTLIYNFLLYFIDSLLFQYSDGIKIEIKLLREGGDWRYWKIDVPKVKPVKILLTVDTTEITCDSTAFTCDQKSY